MTGLYDCERAGGSNSIIRLPGLGDVSFGGSESTTDPVNGNTFLSGFLIGGIIVLLGTIVLILSAYLIMRARK
jgi:hypothetical protein